jgi:hypothetical protein
LSRYSHSITSILPGCHMPNGNKNSGWNEYIFYQGLLMLLHTRIGHRGHKLNLLGDCLDICTTLPLYYQVAICRMATKIQAEMVKSPWIKFSAKNCQIVIFHSGEKFFFPFLTNFFSFISKLPNVARGHQKIREPGRLLGTWYLAVFQKKLGTKLFIFTVKIKFHFIIFLLSFGPRVHFRGQKLTFWSNHPE